MLNVTLFDLGGSIVAPETPDTDFLRRFLDFIKEWMEADGERRGVLVVGGGGAARVWQKACRNLVPDSSHENLDWIGVMATRLNAELIRVLLGDLCSDPVVINPNMDFPFTGRMLVASGWKPGFSTDYDAVLLAERFGAGNILVLSNISQIHEADPRLVPETGSLERLTWDQYRAMTGEQWSPGRKVPFDPVAAKRAAEIGLTVTLVSGLDLANLKALLDGQDFVGTVIKTD